MGTEIKKYIVISDIQHRAYQSELYLVMVSYYNIASDMRYQHLSLFQYQTNPCCIAVNQSWPLLVFPSPKIIF
jgi:hypothetical protein